jgi:hypothetical protein
MAIFFLIAVVVALIVGLIVVLGSPGRHEQMTEEEFEEEAKKKSLLGAAMVGLDKAIQPNRTEHVLVQKRRAEKDDTLPGEPASEDEKTESD